MSFVAFVAAVSLFAEPAWQQVNEDDGIVVFARDVPGARVREVRAEMEVAATPARIIEVLEDIAHYTEFMPYVVEARVLEPLADGHYEYQLIDPPLVDRRDYGIKVTIARNPDGSMVRAWSEANDKAPPLPAGTVRVTVNHGNWRLVPKGKGSAVTYYLYTDPGGSIPAWVANKANNKSLPALMTAVRSRAVDPSWRRD